MTTKQIKPIFGGAYEATEDGEIYSLKRKERRLMVGVVKASGYRMVVITVGRKKQYHNVHRLIAEAFIPNQKNYREVNHKDGNKLNNAVANLEWVTASQNQLHAVTSGLRPSLKLNYEKASEICELYASGNYTQREIAALFNVGKSLIADIINNKRWKRQD